MKTVHISEFQHEYISNKAGRGKVYLILEEIIQADMNLPENKKFLPKNTHAKSKEVINK